MIFQSWCSWIDELCLTWLHDLTQNPAGTIPKVVSVPSRQHAPESCPVDTFVKYYSVTTSWFTVVTFIWHWEHCKFLVIKSLATRMSQERCIDNVQMIASLSVYRITLIYSLPLYLFCLLWWNFIPIRQ